MADAAILEKAMKCCKPAYHDWILLKFGTQAKKAQDVRMGYRQSTAQRRCSSITQECCTTQANTNYAIDAAYNYRHTNTLWTVVLQQR
jgi:hypothetical protein